MKKYWKDVIIVISVFLLYGNTINHGFVLDDFSVIVENRFVKSGTDGIADIFASHYRKGYWNNAGDLYRPLVLTSFALEYELSDGNPFIHHIINLIIYSLIGLLLFRLLSNWFSKEHSYLPLIITLLFLFHPIHTEVVANIKSRDELFSFLFILGSLLSFSKYIKTNHFRFAILMSCSFLLALLSKESSVVFIGVIPLVGYFFHQIKRKETIRIIALLSVPLIIFLILRANALTDQVKAVPVTLSFLTENPINEVLKAGYHLLLYIYKLIVPFSLSSQYPEFYNGLSANVLIVGTIGLVVHVFLLYYGIKWFLQKRIMGFIILLYLITTVLHSNLLLVIGTHFGERLLFTPSVFFCILLGIGLVKILKNKTQHVVLGIILSLYAITVIVRNADWKSNSSLYAADVAKQPQSAMLNYWHSLELTNSNNLASIDVNQRNKSLNEALFYLTKAIDLKPNFGDAEAQIGLVYYKLNKPNEALPYFKKAIAQGRGSVQTLNNIAAIYFGQNNFKEAKLYYEQAVTSDPYYKDAWGNLGVTYAQLNDLPNAERAFLKAIELSPNNGQFYFYMGMTLNEIGRTTEAIPYFEKAFELDPGLKK
ncbi:tetratricopeptide repeat protein [Aquimarina sp. 2201CG14-23]|uniref:tetratricopeptide repeat protein n=1 Tax=Aquimarina mycalae TaxID=3040073 RepID=UPI002477E847|nr:tetratricopeptide repeat protein [Aquimarina sp. 2201CG14-23]MDH7445158.1 tetratricopeptide repeat protein [Aquimarina sp. 2201CG14-23]